MTSEEMPDDLPLGVHAVENLQGCLELALLEQILEVSSSCRVSARKTKIIDPLAMQDCRLR